MSPDYAREYSTMKIERLQQLKAVRDSLSQEEQAALDHELELRAELAPAVLGSGEITFEKERRKQSLRMFFRLCIFILLLYAPLAFAEGLIFRSRYTENKSLTSLATQIAFLSMLLGWSLNELIARERISFARTWFVAGAFFIANLVWLGFQVPKESHAERVERFSAEIETINARMVQTHSRFQLTVPEDYTNALLQMESDIKRMNQLAPEVLTEIQQLPVADRQKMEPMFRLYKELALLKQEELNAATAIRNASATEKQGMFNSMVLPLLQREGELATRAFRLKDQL